MPTTELRSFEKALVLFRLIADGDGNVNTKATAATLQVPISTLYRLLNTLMSNGLIYREKRGEYYPSPELLVSTERFRSKDLMSKVVRSIVQKLSLSIGETIHFGILENDMVTYIAKAEIPGSEVFTIESQQLEAYCSGIGKVLLAGQTENEIEAYLATGPFPQLTSMTITDVDAIHLELQLTLERGFGIDNAEVDETLFCVAVPVRNSRGLQLGALSASSHSSSFITENLSHVVPLLKEGAADIVSRLGGK